MRGKLAFTLAFLLCGCGDQIGETILGTGQLRAEAEPDRAEAEMRALMRADAPRMVLRIPQHGLAVTLLAAGTREGVVRWRDTENAQILTREGMVIATRGLGDDLMAVQADGALALILAGAEGQVTRLHRHLDGEDRIEIHSWVCDIAPQGHDTVRIAETTRLEALLVTESCHGPRGTFSNRYWLREGRILQSWQFAGSALGQMHLLFLP